MGPDAFMKAVQDSGPVCGTASSSQLADPNKNPAESAALLQKKE